MASLTQVTENVRRAKEMKMRKRRQTKLRRKLNKKK